MILKSNVKHQNNLDNLSTSLTVLIQLELIDKISLILLQQAVIAINSIDNSWIKDGNYSSGQIKTKVYQQQLELVSQLVKDICHTQVIVN